MFQHQTVGRVSGALLGGLVAGIGTAGWAQGPISSATSRDFRVGVFPVSVAVGDFNGDGVLDLAVANSVNNSVSILLGLGDGSFTADSRFMVGRRPASVAVGDFDGDGVLDLAVANSDSSTVSVLLGVGDGSFY